MKYCAALILFVLMGGAGCDGLSGSTDTPPSDSTDASSVLKIDWMHDYQSVDGIQLSPTTVGDSLVLFSGAGRLQALRVKNGSVFWKSDSVDPKNVELRGHDLLLGPKAAYGAHVRNVYAWNVSDGSLKWTLNRPADTGLYELGRYALGPNHVFLFGNGPQVLRVDQASGAITEVWRYTEPIFGATYRDNRLYLGQAWVPDGAEGQARGALTKVNATTGDTLWTFETERGGFYDMRPIVHDDRVLAGTREGDAAFFAVDKETGEEIWRNRQGFTFAADHGDGYVYLNTSAELMSISEETGRTVWKTDMPGGSGFGGVVYHDGYVYHPRGSALIVVDADDGTIVHQEPSPSGYFWTLHAGAGRIFAQSSGHLIAYKPYQP
ncbi:MAG: PQQ-binding-like beta-propeller repeat protein [Bacteroidetes bacterium]|jgi:outer membrane protein assembly factor BamB|nr:PQQ-binding-like beta-propeller repeat protein [Bacteroidota bacterium]